MCGYELGGNFEQAKLDQSLHLGSHCSCGREETLAMSFVIFSRRTRKLWWKQNLDIFFCTETSNRGNSVSFQAFSLIFGAKLACEQDESFELSFVCLSEK